MNSIVWFVSSASRGFGLEITRAAFDRGDAVVAAMRAHREGRIVNLSSVGGFTATPGFGVYAATKFAVEGLSEAMHAELRPLGIDVIIVEPGVFRTDFLDPISLQRAARIIDDYASTSGAAREWAAVTNHAQCGDPAKAAATIIEVATTPSPPLRLHLGADSVSRIEAKIHYVARELIQWRALAVSTGDPGPADDGASETKGWSVLKDGVFSMSAIASLSHDEETSRSIVEPEILLPVQLADPHTKQGEKRLMLAVLEEAVGTFQRNVHAKSRRGQRLFREAEEWIASPDTSWMFAFESICHTLGLDPHYLRGGLESLKERRPASGARVYQFRRVSGRRTSVAPTRARLDEGAERRRVS